MGQLGSRRQAGHLLRLGDRTVGDNPSVGNPRRQLRLQFLRVIPGEGEFLGLGGLNNADEHDFSLGLRRHVTSMPHSRQRRIVPGLFQSHRSWLQVACKRWQTLRVTSTIDPSGNTSSRGYRVKLPCDR